MLKMEKYLVIGLIVLAIFVVLGASLLGYTLLTAQAPQAQQVQYVCPDGRTAVASISLCPQVTSAPTARALTIEEQLSICMDMPSVQQGSLEDICYMLIAAKHGNTSLCRKVSTSMRSQCYNTLAEVKEDVNVCAEASPYKDQCYSQYAQRVGDPAICDKITDVSSRDRCYSDMASKGTDPALCDKIKTVYLKEDCYFSVAMRTRDAAYCDKITDSSRKQNCLENIQGQPSTSVPVK